MRSPERSVRRRLLLLVAALGLLVPYGYSLTQLWTATGGDLAFARSERDGVAYLQPLVRLVSATADAQSAAVGGGKLDTGALRDAAAAVAAVDGRLGDALGTHDRWSQIATRLDAVTAAPPTGAAAYAAFSQLTDLQLALVAAVGDSSNLILDPALDSYYVMDTTLLRLPRILVDAGRLSDRATATGAQLFVETTRAQVRADAAAVDSGLGKSFATTRSRTLGPALLPALDRLRAAASRLAPLTAELGGTVTSTPAQDAEARIQVRDAALGLETAGLGQLDVLLASRQSDLDQRRLLVMGAAGVGALLALGAWWLLGRGPSGSRTGADEDQDDEREDDEPADEARDEGFEELLEARELLDSRQLTRVGRAVAPQRKAQR